MSEMKNMGSDPAIGQGGEVAREAGNPEAKTYESERPSVAKAVEPDRSRQPTVEELQDLLRAARYYVFNADCPAEHLYDDQQALLTKIDEMAPAPLPPARPEVCGRELAPGIRCASDKGHEGECDDIPF